MKEKVIQMAELNGTGYLLTNKGRIFMANMHGPVQLDDTASYRKFQWIELKLPNFK